MKQAELTKKQLCEFSKIKELFKFHFVTGTYGFGYESFDDIDIVVFGGNKTSARNLLEENGFVLEEVNGGSLGSIKTIAGVDEVPFNIICVHHTERDAWKLATNVLKQLEPIRNREQRHGIFEIIRGLCKANNLCHRKTKKQGQHFDPFDPFGDLI